MPHITRLCVSHFRNLESVDIIPAQDLNLIFGQNGAGKSSLLEALAFLSRGKSTRTNIFRRVIQHESEGLTLFATVCPNDSLQESELKLGIEKLRNGDSTVRIDGRNVSRSSELAHQLPLLLLDNVAFDLLGSGAKERRQFFDWLVFHVKHEFSDVWKQYNRLIKQRNSLLRHDRIAYSDVIHWDRQLVTLAEKINQLRLSCLHPFSLALWKYIDSCKLQIQGRDVRVSYADGWKHNLLEDEGSSAVDSSSTSFNAEACLEHLKKSFETDKKLGYTGLGPHRSELKIQIEKTNAGEVLSRGQQKIVISAMYFAKGQVYRTMLGKSPIVLIDDLPSELDQNHQSLVGEWLKELQSQAFITGIEHPDLSRLAEGFQSYKVFHVKHGTVEEVGKDNI